MTITLKDPVCQMEVAPESAAGRSLHEGMTYYFCSSRCKRSFDKDPERYLGQLATPHAHACC